MRFALLFLLLAAFAVTEPVQAGVVRFMAKMMKHAPKKIAHATDRTLHALGKALY